MPTISANVTANSALRYLNSTSASQSASAQRIASSARITKASDDAAGLAISTALSSDVSVISKAATNLNDASSALQVADSGTIHIGDLVQRMKSLATQSAGNNVTAAERKYLNTEFNSLNNEITTIVNSTKYNDVKVIDGSYKSTQITSPKGDSIDISIGDFSTKALGTDKLSVDSKENAEAAISALDQAISQISTGRANIGATASRLEFSYETTANMDVSTQASKITDADIAKESAELSSGKVQLQASVAALYQANSTPQAVLSLLR